MKTIKQLAIEHSCDKAAIGHHSYDLPYETHFGPFRDKQIKLLELGIGGYSNPNEGGASLRMFKEYFTHPYTQIYGIDIVDKKAIEEERIKTFHGSATDEEFLNKVIDEIGEPDLIVEDGSHINTEVIASFKILFPKLKVGGIYVLEDLQTSYWNHYGGQISGEWGDQWVTSMNFLKERCDGLNFKEIITEQRGYTNLAMGLREPDYFDLNILSIHFYHNIVFVVKGDNTVTA